MGGGKEYIGERVFIMEVYLRYKGLVLRLFGFRFLWFRFGFAFRFWFLWFFLGTTFGASFRHGRTLDFS